LLLLVFATALTLARPAVDTDPVIQYYWDKVRDVYVSQDPVSAGIRYRLVATTYFKHIDSKGRVEKIDSATVEYFCREGQVDSQKTVSGDDSRFRNLDITITDIFGLDYQPFSFPNDTGGAVLAIGLDTDSLSANPDGLIMVDRYRYVPVWLYLYYPEKRGYRRFSRSFRFTEVDSYVFPDSIWEVGARQGVFSLEHYRLETGVTTIEILP